jgi:hypothetical protein
MKDKYSFRCPHSEEKMSCPFIDTAGMDKTQSCDTCQYNKDDNRGDRKHKRKRASFKKDA